MVPGDCIIGIFPDNMPQSAILQSGFTPPILWYSIKKILLIKYMMFEISSVLPYVRCYFTGMYNYHLFSSSCVATK